MAVTSDFQRASRHVTVLGSTGSIGQNTIKTLLAAKEIFAVEALTARENVLLLAQQAREVKARRAVIGNPEKYQELKALLADTEIEVAAGDEAVVEAAAIKADWVMSAIVGAAGLRPTLAAIRQGTKVALANKECLVCAGHLMMEEVKKYGAELIPVDSEHSAITQAWGANRTQDVRKITLTASGGPFCASTLEEMQRATPQQAVNHPNWDMGAKISVDSATMVNKGLELIEAYHLFPVSLEQIEVLVHPESVIHGMVEYKDGSVLAQLGSPDMVTPIAVALAWPHRMEAPSEPFSLLQRAHLTFEAVDSKRFPAVDLAREAIRKNGSAPIVMNAMNEVAVDAFLKGRIGFMQIVRYVEQVIENMHYLAPNSLQDVIDLDQEVRALSLEHIRKKSLTAA